MSDLLHAFCISAEDIRDSLGTGRIIRLEARSSDDNIICELAFSAYDNFPDAILLQALFRNVSGKEYEINGYSLDNIELKYPEPEEIWWTFQGAVYKWGQDFAFELPGNFKRDNFMGLNTIKAGAGIPLTDFWNKDYGLALACISSRPELISLPVKAEGGIINVALTDTLSAITHQPR